MKLSKLFAILGFIIFTGGGVQLIITIRGAEGFSNLEGDLPSQLIYLSVYIVTFLILLLSKHVVNFGIINNPWFWLLLAWTSFSVVWSGAPGITIRHVVAILGTTLFSVFLVHNFTVEEFIKLLAISLLIVIVASYLAIIFYPKIGIGHVVTDEWKGIFTHKNHLGKAASLATFIFTYLALTINQNRWLWVVACLASIGLLIGSQSAAAIMISIVVEFLIIVYLLYKRMPQILWVGSVGLMCFLVIAPLPKVDEILGYFGKNETLTGRTQLWYFSLKMAIQKPILGYGYGAFWLGWDSPSAQIGPDSPMDLDITHSHNGFIELFLDIGGIGLFLMVMTYLAVTRESLVFLLKKEGIFKYSFHLMLLIWILPYNISEQALLTRNSIFWVLFSSIVLYQVKLNHSYHEIFS